MIGKHAIICFLNLVLRYKSIIIFLVFIFYSGHFLWNHSIVKLSMITDVHGNFKIYSPDRAGEFSEENAAGVKIRPQQTEYFFIANRLNKRQQIRIDPINQIARLKINTISFYQFPFSKVDIVSDRRFDKDLTRRLKANSQISFLKVLPTDIVIKTDGSDGQIKISVNPHQDAEFTLVFVFFIGFILLAVCVLHYLAAYNLESYGIIPILMSMVLGLILVMSFISKPQVHPDESIHIKSAKYYSENWIPPKICQPETEWAYSPYGVSRLNSLEAFYFFAGKYYVLAKFLPGPMIFQFRSLNFLFFSMLTLMALLRPEFRLYCIPLLLSPQIWYVFSYFNSDAFALFVCYLLIYQFFMPDSFLNRFINKNGNKIFTFLSGIFWGGILIGLIPFIKKNYYVFGIYILCFGFLKLMSNRHEVSRSQLMNWGAVLCMGLLIVTARYGFDAYLNGLSRSNKESQCREALAKYKFKPSTPADDQWFGLSMRQKGVTLQEVFNRYGWGRISFQSTFGVYGPMSIYPNSWIISIYKAILLCFAGIIIYCGFKGNLMTWGHILNFSFWSVVLIFASLWNSWNVDLQNQGRYFFPIITMGATLLGVIKTEIPKHSFNILTILTFFVGIYSYVTIGLVGIPKV